MAQPPVPLSMLLTKDVPYEWHDGVALAAQLVAQVRAESNEHDRIPDLRAVTLEEDGMLTLSPHAEQDMPAMPGAAQILQQLLSGKDQPAPLRLFAMQAATTEPTPTLDWFGDELAKWERPNRSAKLGALYFRAFEQIGPAALTEEARAREDRARGPVQHGAVAAAASKKPKKPKPPSAPRDPRDSNQLVVAVVIVVALAAAGGAWYLLGRPMPGSLASPRAGADQAQAVPAADDKDASPGAPGARAAGSKQVARRRESASGSPAIDRAEAELARARELFQRQDYVLAGAGFERVLGLLGTESSPQAEEVRQVARSLAEVARAAAVEQTAAATREYRAGDPGVVDPVPLAYLPPGPDPSTPPEKLQVLEVHINTSGTVDSVKFVMNRPSFRNSWWTSAAKAWRFSPATKDGKAVRYVMRIVMDDSAGQR